MVLKAPTFRYLHITIQSISPSLLCEKYIYILFNYAYIVYTYTYIDFISCILTLLSLYCKAEQSTFWSMLYIHITWVYCILKQVGECSKMISIKRLNFPIIETFLFLFIFVEFDSRGFLLYPRLIYHLDCNFEFCE